MSELQNLASFLMADGCDYLTGQTIAIDGAQYITGGGTFSGLSKLKDSDWEEIKSMIKSTNEKDKANRNTYIGVRYDRYEFSTKKFVEFLY